MSLSPLSSHWPLLSQRQQKIKEYGETCAKCITIAGGVFTLVAGSLIEAAKPLSDYYSCSHNTEKHKSECRDALTHELLIFFPASCLTACVCAVLTIGANRVCHMITNWAIKKYDSGQHVPYKEYGAL